MNQLPKPFEKYRHFKGNMYQILAIAKDSVNGEDMVVYQGLYEPYQIYVRSAKMFLGKVDKVKYPECNQEKRFQRIEETVQETVQEPAQVLGEVTVVQDNAPLAEEQDAKASNQKAGEIDPALARFLDAVGEEEKLDVLFEIKNQLTPQILIPMELSLGMEPQDTTIEERYRGIKTLLLTKQKYERHRL